MTSVRQTFSIYRITNMVDGKIYIGFSNNPHQRFIQHRSDARKGKDGHFRKAIRKHGEENFVMDILYMSYDRDHTLHVIEPMLIAEYACMEPRGYNTRSGGECGSTHSPEVRAKISASHLGKKRGPQTPEWIAKRTQNRKPNSRPQTEEHKRKNAEANTGKLNHFFGKSHSEESRKRISESALSRPKLKCVCGKEASPSNFKRWHSNCV